MAQETVIWVDAELALGETVAAIPDDSVVELGGEAAPVVTLRQLLGYATQ